MGLDMYLSKKTYVQNWNHMDESELHDVTVKKGGKVRKDIKPERVSEITESVAYWRKANQIHNWFVENVQGGEDDCREYYVDREQLQELLDICLQVRLSTTMEEGVIANGKVLKDGVWMPNFEEGKNLKDTSVAEELLPTSSGFFFGGTDYDEWYMQQIEYTIKTLTELLEEKEGGDFYYQASW